jgi:2-oxoisovalerate ferredoxin oxidoreductase beta subunit
MSVKRTIGMYASFDRSGADTRSSHYCGGCGHGILHKLIAEALVDLGLQDRTILISPIGCAVFGYYYWDTGNIQAAHGRAPAVATALNRTLRDAVVIAYQGDGDLGAIGFNCTFQAASRGERMATFFVNNATYGMTGGQMAPTSLIGQKTATSPHGRTATNEGYPLHVCEVIDRLQAPVYIERCSLADTARIMQSRRAVRRALELQRDGKGYAFVEFLSPCPTNMGMDAVQAAQFVTDQLEREYPLGVLRDQSATAQPRPARTPCPSVSEYFGTGHEDGCARPVDASRPALRLKFAGFGGQGILSLSLCVAEAGRLDGCHTAWLPSYGPEQRGGAASCSVVVSGKPVGSPAVDSPDILICMNQPAYERFAPTVCAGGLLIHDATVVVNQPPPGVRLWAVPAIDLAQQLGVPRAANTVMLAALAFTNATGLRDSAWQQALEASFRAKPALVEKNRRVFEAAMAWCREHLK